MTLSFGWSCSPYEALCFRRGMLYKPVFAVKKLAQGASGGCSAPQETLPCEGHLCNGLFVSHSCASNTQPYLNYNGFTVS